eukprot:CAMPEP_0202966010 /NCGR_PEP_ID=MMETSP1396-20130829/10204_1 /ASSEMBLY_ACC=CAM_ASM_000872 /TAXON_ID= /ORGANISM="Pseudokeronopsis sp., Strain Brazil" /LENGTH=158 /DNA_ID=CAMNT_0049689335 /DNA_START=479 /DNA_END=955 /DNA_ORIENTATION=-
MAEVVSLRNENYQSNVGQGREDQVHNQRRQEVEEVAVVVVAEAVVDVGTMVVESFHTPLAVEAVEGVVGFDGQVVEAEVLVVDVVLIRHIQDRYYVELGFDEARVVAGTGDEGNGRHGEANTTQREKNLHRHVTFLLGVPDLQDVVRDEQTKVDDAEG